MGLHKWNKSIVFTHIYVLLVEQRHVSCTFDKRFICGYDTSWVAIDSLSWKRCTGDEDNTFYEKTEFPDLGEPFLLLRSMPPKGYTER